MTVITLKEVAQIESGKSFRSRIEDDPDGDCIVIQMKDISKEAMDMVGQPQRVSSAKVSSNQMLNKGDLLFLAKGNHNYAIRYNYDQPATVVSLFFIIRTDQEKLDSGYLEWFINSSDGQAYFNEKRLGAAVGNIRKKDLENLPIILPSLEVQRQIAGLNQKIFEEKKLVNLIFEKRELFINEKLKEKLL